MVVVPIRITGDPILHTPTRRVPVGADGSLPLGLARLIDDLYETLAASKGVGLSANQIGADQRVFVYDCPEVRGDSRRHRGCVVNPMLETADRPAGPPDPDSDEEGCLSVPGEKFPIGRANWARVTGLDTDGEPVTVEGTGLLARMLQHEIGHLDGQLYIDRLVAPYAARAADAVAAHGWGVPGLTWTPGVDPNPFGV
ncbi:peptide deformylase [Mycobacterium sp. URHB0021]|jgi:peptide deformylase